MSAQSTRRAPGAVRGALFGFVWDHMGGYGCQWFTSEAVRATIQACGWWRMRHTDSVPDRAGSALSQTACLTSSRQRRRSLHSWRSRRIPTPSASQAISPRGLLLGEEEQGVGRCARMTCDLTPVSGATTPCSVASGPAPTLGRSCPPAGRGNRTSTSPHPGPEPDAWMVCPPARRDDRTATPGS